LNNQDIQSYYSDNPVARWLALTSICLATFINAIQNSSINIAIPNIVADLHADAILVSWIPTAFLLTSVVMLLPSGRLADLHGRKKIYLSGIVLLGLASALAVVAQRIEWLLFTRMLQGIGAAMTFATGLALVMSLFTSENRGVALGLASGSLYIGLACGPLIGGWLTESYGWRSVFMFPVPLLAVSFTLISVRVKGDWTGEHQQRVDWLGCFILAVWTTALFVGVSRLPGMESVVLIMIGMAGLTGFVYQQAGSEYPLIRFGRIINNQVFLHSLLASTCVYSSNYPLIFLFSLYLQYIQGLSPIAAGQIMVLQALMMALLAPISGRLSDNYEPRIIATTGCLIMFGAFLVLQSIDTDTSLYLIGGALMTLGVGFGLFTTPNNNAALSSIDKSRLSIGSALLNLARVAGNILGTAVVLVLVSIFIGGERIDPDRYDALLTVIHWTLAISSLCTLTGAYFSYTRGNIRADANR
jgi:EmrB/QacA subfamily drug resistance transporter